MALPTLISLTQLISDSLAKMTDFCDTSGVSLPSLDEPFTVEGESIRMHPEISEAVSYIVSAAAQIIAIVQPAPLTLFTSAIHVHVSSALRVAVDTNVVEILREAGPQGLHVREISKKTGIDCDKLGRILRLLCSEYIFEEIAPDIFINNRISSAMDTGKSYQELIQKPEDKFIGTNGIAANVSRSTDESVKSSAFLFEALTHPLNSKHTFHLLTPFNLAFRTDLPLFSWLAQKGNEDRLRRFGIALDGFENMLPSNGVLMGYRWDLLPSGSIVVDVGGGIGTESMKISKAFPGLKLIVQDTTNVVANGIKHFQDAFPEGLTSGRVDFQVHDFLKDQPVTNARIFFLRFILHDWPDAICIQILKNLRASATPNTELIITECLIQHTCSTQTSVDENIPGACTKVHPRPLLANLGYARVFDHLMDLQMAVVLNGVERTVGQYAVILQNSGWKFKEVLRMPESSFVLHKIVATPAEC